jgi:hypothetical protein
MDKNITVTCSTDNTMALTAFARAFSEMAGLDIPSVIAVNLSAGYRPDHIAVIESPITDNTAPKLPWDERIHAGSRATNKDDSWTLRRKPKDLDESQWAARIEEVTAELEALMAIPVPMTPPTDGVLGLMGDAPPDESPYGGNGYTSDDIIAANPSLSQTVNEVLLPPPVTFLDLNASLAATDVPPPPVPAPIAPPVTDFAGLMKWLTTNITPANKHLVDMVLQQQGLTALPQLNQRPELIPAFIAALGALL